MCNQCLVYSVDLQSGMNRLIGADQHIWSAPLGPPLIGCLQLMASTLFTSVHSAFSSYYNRLNYCYSLIIFSFQLQIESSIELLQSFHDTLLNYHYLVIVRLSSSSSSIFWLTIVILLFLFLVGASNQWPCYSLALNSLYWGRLDLGWLCNLGDSWTFLPSQLVRRLIEYSITFNVNQPVLMNLVWLNIVDHQGPLTRIRIE